MEPIVIHPAESLHGRLQRGRGCAARRAAGTPGARDLIYDCVSRDPRWDTLEARGLYYARLILDLELQTTPIVEHIFDPEDRLDTEPDRTNLALDVLTHLVRLGRREAAVPLRRYATEGGNWYTALQSLVELDDPVLADGLDEVAADRCDDRALAWLCGVDGAVTRMWARRQPRIAAARRPETRPHEPRASLTGHTDADLAALVRTHGDGATAAILELGRRRSRLVLDLVEEFLPGGSYDGPLCRAVRDLGPAALARARVWAGEQRSYQDVGIDVIAAHGTESDAPPLLTALKVALDEEDWDLAAVPVDGLGRLRSRSAIPLLLYGWQESASSRLRANLLGALARIDPHVAEPYLVEALWDCEGGARRIAAGAVPLDGSTRARLRRLRHEEAEEADVRSAATARLTGNPN
ncbi:HEAT repeat domain-containing protein [Actinoallomurus purpureus]|uniref:HEAT repeat domain-containing protein n=1 Tax=Actinoallomurus purpureus TaxID=478114 RepID=UPI00209232EF|nr:HEAT repeat domain-containing protein [Actinoallomurus purpureus]MCO6005898.1 HEAT repeat domain-containing protein [Actinoallomurus purpureus]